MALQRMFSPLRVRGLELPNRFVVSPMVTNYCTEDGRATGRYLAYHEAKARGGWGLIITEDYVVEPRGRGFSNIPGFWKDEHIESHRELTRRVHAHGSKIFAQIYHCGRQTNHHIMGETPVAPSAIPCPVNQETPHELTRTEIQELVEKFGDAAKRAQLAGFDGVEVHGAHGYLIAQFLSSYSNKRTDEYGGPLNNRMRFAKEIVRNMRQKTGNSFPIGFRISGDEMVSGGRGLHEAQVIAAEMEATGVDYIHVTVGVYASAPFMIPPSALKPGWLTDHAEEVKKCVSIPVIAVNRINDPLLAEQVVASGKADLVAMGRASLADPALPNKALSEAYDEIRPCIGCLQGCLRYLFQNQSITCLVNPSLGREQELALDQAETPRHVVVAGGGPAGAEAAWAAARRGHRVDLFEASDRLGGQYRLAAVPPKKGEISGFLRWQERMLEKYGVKVHLNTPLTRDTVRDINPEVLVAATGSTPLPPEIPGLAENGAVSAQAVLEGKAQVGPRVAVLGGGMTGAETADYLAQHGKQVTVVEMLEEIAQDMEAAVKEFLWKDYVACAVEVLTCAEVREAQNGYLIADCRGERLELGPFDTIVYALGNQSERELLRGLSGSWETHEVGDVKEPRQAIEAVHEAHEVAHRL